jgi:hypothetical protein
VASSVGDILHPRTTVVSQDANARQIVDLLGGIDPQPR